MFELPTSIQVAEQSFTIENRGDFRMVLDCFAALNDSTLTKEERIVAALIIFYEDFKCVEDVLECDHLEYLVKEMYTFFNCGQPGGVGQKVRHNLIDWQRDEQLICSAVNNVANKEIRLEQYIHWWTFMGYFLAIGESPMSTIVSIRNKILEDKKLEKYEQEFRKANPQYFEWDSTSTEEKEAKDIILEMWNS